MSVSGSQGNVYTTSVTLMFCEGKLDNNSERELVWFAMSATFGRALKAKTFLESKSIECFVPMKYELLCGKTQNKVRKLVPAINNLIFVRASKSQIQSAKSEVDFLQYLTRPEKGRNVPIIVPEYQMQQFIKVCQIQNDSVTYLSPDEVDLAKGTPVKIIGSAFDGVEGLFMKVKNGRKKRVVVLIQGIIAAMLAEVEDGYIQVLEP